MPRARSLPIVLLLVVVPATGLQAAEQHFSKATKPPGPNERLAALPDYGARLGVPPGSDADRQFDTLVDEFLRAYFRSQPVRATNVGIHDFDALLPATTRADFDTTAMQLKGFLARFEGIPSADLGRERRFDQAMLASRLRGMLLDLETVQTWKRDPNFYLSIASGSVHSLLKRDFAPLDKRLWNVISRIQQIPYLLRDARTNLENPPRIYAEIAIAQAAGLVRFLGTQVPAQVQPIRDPVEKEEFEHHLAAAVGAANDFHDWLKEQLLSQSNGNFALGPDVYAKKLLYDEMVSTPLDDLFARGERELRATQQRMASEANAIETGLTVRDALARLESEAPSARDLVPLTESQLSEIRRFVADHRILTPPASEDLQVAETPVFQRSLSFASMDSPGVLETRATEAYYYVTPPDSTWPADRQKDHMKFYNPVQLEVISIHEALPGHYYQFLSLKKCPSLIRSLFGPGSNSEGWAHYCEEMVLDAGFRKGDPRYRLAQQNLALQRICRYLVGLSLHTRGMTYEDAVTFFEREGYMARVNAEREARRGTSDPTYLVYSLGKWAILDLRNEVRLQEGASFDRTRFHDRFLSYGRSPIALIREDWFMGD